MIKSRKEYELAIIKAQDEIETRYGPIYYNINNCLQLASIHLAGLSRNIDDNRYVSERLKYIKANLAMVNAELTNIENTLKEFIG
jgi:hypothetical protein